jgi:diadenosine tetraphosphatase ApaH/serine/threonine PP2A family protein phosphatase
MAQGLYTPIPELISEVTLVKTVKTKGLLRHKQKPVAEIIKQRLSGADSEARTELGEVLVALHPHRIRILDKNLFLDEHHVQRLERYALWHVEEVVLSRDYMGVVFRRPGDERPWMAEYRFIVIGINDFKSGLFVNEFREPLWLNLERQVLVRENEFGAPFTITATTDRQFMKNVFDYDEEAPGNGVLSVREGVDSTAYRVQGEVVFVLRRFDPEKIARDWVGGTITEGIEYVVRELLYRTLVEGGVKVERATDDEWWVNWDNGLLRLVKHIAQVLNGHYKLTSVWVEGREAGVGVVVSDVRVVLVAKPRDDYKDGYIVRVNVDENSVKNTPLYNEVAKHVVERLRQFIGGGINNTFTMEVGLHDVTINNASRLDVTIDPKPLGVALPFSIRVYDENAFVVTERSSAVVRHIIHGEKAFRFDGEYLLWVRTTGARE